MQPNKDKQAAPLRPRDRDRTKPSFAPARQSIMVVGRVASRVRTSSMTTFSKANSLLIRARNASDDTPNSSPWGVGVAASMHAPVKPSQSENESALDEKEVHSSSPNSSSVCTSALSDTSGPASTNSSLGKGAHQMQDTPPTESRHISAPAATNSSLGKGKGAHQMQDTPPTESRQSSALAATPIYLSPTARGTMMFVDVPKEARAPDVTQSPTDRKRATRRDAKASNFFAARGTAAWGFVRTVSRRTFGNGPAVKRRTFSAAEPTAATTLLKTESCTEANGCNPGDHEELARSRTTLVCAETYTGSGLERDTEGNDAAKGNERTDQFTRRWSRSNITGIFARLGRDQLLSSTKKDGATGEAPVRRQRRRKLRPGWMVSLGDSDNRSKRGQTKNAEAQAAVFVQPTPKSPPKIPGDIDFVEEEFFDSDEDDDLNAVVAPMSLLNDDFITYQTKRKGANNNKSKVRNRGRP